MKFKLGSIFAVLCGLVAPVAIPPAFAGERAITTQAQVGQSTTDRKGDTVTTSTAPTDASGSDTSAPTQLTEKVLILGSSVAAGWHDEQGGGGYLQRAFASLSALGDTHYDVESRAIPGQGVMHIVDKYPVWIKNIHPDIVVLAWGALDDAHDKTPISDFRTQIQGQIQTALDNHAVVFVVTPPVTKASYTQFSNSQANLLANEIDVAKGFHSPNVHVFDVFDEMKQYLVQHNQTYVPYMSDGWHPNALGHILGAQLIVDDFFSEFGVQTVKFQNPRIIKSKRNVSKTASH